MINCPCWCRIAIDGLALPKGTLIWIESQSCIDGRYYFGRISETGSYAFRESWLKEV